MGGICTPQTSRNSEIKTELVADQIGEEEKQYQVRANMHAPKQNEEINEHEVEDEQKIIIKEFEDNVLNFGKYISEMEKEEKVHDNVKRVEAKIKKFEIAKEHLDNFKNVFNRDPIMFHDESIYHGSWNYQGKKEGFGQFIKIDGSKYTGFWKNDKIEGKGRYIDKNGNFYEGI
jgi:DNA repair exonuclease SbcCD ATPase subunit